MASISKSTEKTFYALALARIGLGFIFLRAFFDKLLGLGFSTCRNALTEAINTGCSQSWAGGGSPTSGFLENATKGPLAGFYQNLAGQAWVDWLFMAGLLVVGVGLVLGIWVRLASIVGILMLLLMWTALLWPENNPVIDDHIIYSLLLAAIYLGNSQQKWGFRCWWIKQPLVRNNPALH